MQICLLFIQQCSIRLKLRIVRRQEKKENYARGLSALLEKDRVIRKNRRLRYYEMEKKCKILLKKSGLFGKEKKSLAIAELRGLNSGKKDFRKLLEKEI